ncbi:hypothetical protein FISHEDRAFT_77975 [Fistulina hepatica ATCC 64428]|nr:hypothetical protein FISHEDRAFT_77975 [Fistulina hepatica ATCC 64428]
MAAPYAEPPAILCERVDIHKSCKSIESLLVVFNDYCETLGTLALLQKKLSKALRSTAALKVTGEISGNALSASATIFEVAAEVDSKLSKFADKEYTIISTEVKKWFKKLAKDERTHDDRIATANTKVAHAGQTYEKKTKKSGRDATEEQTRYINLINSLGTEIAQEKYKHMSEVTQRHIATTYSVAASLARVADAEWLRTCEGLRRAAPIVGRLGEWRTLCESGWQDALPPDLPAMDDEPDSSPDIGTFDATLKPRQLGFDPALSAVRLDADSMQRQPLENSSPIPRSSTSPSFEPPRLPVDPSTGSLRSLSAFPAPPSYLPVPLENTNGLLRQSTRSGEPLRTNTLAIHPLDAKRSVDGEQPGGHEAKRSSESSDRLKTQSVASHTVIGSAPPSPKAHFREKESGVRPEGSSPNDVDSSTDSPAGSNGPSVIGRSDSAKSRSSVVAEMRKRYSSGSNSSTPLSQKEALRLSTNVSDIVARYQPVEVLQPPRATVASPVPAAGTPLPPLSDPVSLSRQAEASFRDPGRPTTRRQINSAPPLNSNVQLNNNTQVTFPRRSGDRDILRSTRQTSLQVRNQTDEFGAVVSSPGLRSPTSPNQYISRPPYTNPQSSSSRSLPVPPPIRSMDEHAPYCGCERCSVSKYKLPSPSPPMLTPPVAKPRGWIRRLSMPVVGKSSSVSQLNKLKSGKKNISMVALGVHEDPRAKILRARHSYDVSPLASSSSLPAR